MYNMKDIWAIIRAVIIKSVGRLSAGISLSLEHGLTSGAMLEYVYDNRSQGRFILGKMIDRLFLNCPDWQAIRIRKDNVKNHIQQALVESKSPARLVDIAAGFARYIQEALSPATASSTEIVLMDTEHSYIASVKDAFLRMGSRVRYENKSALDESFLQSLRPATVVVAAGFYDWIIDDGIVQRSINLVRDILSSGGTFILTGQSKTADLNLMRHAFVDFNHAPMVMKTRSAHIMSQWLTASGFKVQCCDSDQRGYYHTIKAVKL